MKINCLACNNSYDDNKTDRCQTPTCLEITKIDEDKFNRVEAIREKFAELCHKQWSGWMKYMITRFNKIQGNILTGNQDIFYVPTSILDRWKLLTTREYNSLALPKKTLKREEADKILKIIVSLSKEN